VSSVSSVSSLVGFVSSVSSVSRWVAIYIYIYRCNFDNLSILVAVTHCALPLLASSQKSAHSRSLLPL
jgi:hypothetical protein